MLWRPYLREQWMPWHWAWDLRHPYMRLTGPWIWIKDSGWESR